MESPDIQSSPPSDPTSEPSGSSQLTDDIAIVDPTPVKPKKVIIPASQRRLTDQKKALQYQWTYYFCEGTHNGQWEPKSIANFHTVYDFWAIHNNLVPPSRLGMGYEYLIFKKDIPPKWESPMNASGGTLTLEVNPAQISLDFIDNLWLSTLLALLGEYYQQSSYINGIRLMIRTKVIRIALWVNTCEQSILDSIMNDWVLNMDSKQHITFAPFTTPSSDQVNTDTSSSLSTPLAPAPTDSGQSLDQGT